MFYKLSRKPLGRTSNCKTEMAIAEAEVCTNRKAQVKTYLGLIHVPC